MLNKIIFIVIVIIEKKDMDYRDKRYGLLRANIWTIESKEMDYREQRYEL